MNFINANLHILGPVAILLAGVVIILFFSRSKLWR